MVGFFLFHAGLLTCCGFNRDGDLKGRKKRDQKVLTRLGLSQHFTFSPWFFCGFCGCFCAVAPLSATSIPLAATGFLAAHSTQDFSLTVLSPHLAEHLSKSDKAPAGSPLVHGEHTLCLG